MNSEQVAILTGDVVNSREVPPEAWMALLREALSFLGTEGKDWEIYRGDSFQIKSTVETALHAALLIKATVKQSKDVDVRLGIGLGKMNYDAQHLTASNGTAFIRSGNCFDGLKKNTLALESGHTDFDWAMNLMLELGGLTADRWTEKSATLIKTALQYENMNQNELAKLLKKTQGTVSEGLKRAGYYEFKKMLHYYKNHLPEL